MPQCFRGPNMYSNGEEIEIPDFSDDDSDTDGTATGNGSVSNDEPLDEDDEAAFALPIPSDFATREDYLAFVKASQLALGKSATRIRELKLEIQTHINTIRQLKSRGKSTKSNMKKVKKQVKKADEDYAAELGRRFGLLFELFLRKDAFLKERPAHNSLYPHRYMTAASRLCGQTAELYEALEESLHPAIERSPAFRDEFHAALLGRRKYSWNQLRSKTGSQIFSFLNPPAGIYIAKNGAQRATFQPFLDFLQFPMDSSNYRPLMFKDCEKDFSGLLRVAWLPEVLRASLLGANSIMTFAGSSEPTTPAPNSSGKLWNVDCTTPGGMAYAIIATMYIHSSDESFGSVGSESGFHYERTFDFIKHLVVDALRDTLENKRGRAHMLKTIEFWNDVVFASLDKRTSDGAMFGDDVDTGLNALNTLSIHNGSTDPTTLSDANSPYQDGTPSVQQNISTSSSVAAPNTNTKQALPVGGGQEMVEATARETGGSHGQATRGRGRSYKNTQVGRGGEAGGPVRRSGRVISKV